LTHARALARAISRHLTPWVNTRRAYRPIALVQLSKVESDEFLFLVNRNSYHLELIHRIDQQPKRMTDLTRSSTLSLRRPAAALTSRPKASTATATAAKPADSVSGSSETSDRVVRSDTLLQGHSHISIVHNGETYQLRATRLGKLILTK
jgi:hemin uptake protein HemP